MKKLAQQFGMYLVSGGLAVVADFGSYFLLLQLDVWYVTANVIGNILGFFATFLLHKYLVFGKKDEIVNHFVRYCILTGLNIIAQTALLYLFVESFHLDEGSAKFISWAITVLWNFFLYKYFVYV